MNLEAAFIEAFSRGQADRAQAHQMIGERLNNIKQTLEQTGLGLNVQTTDYDGLFVKNGSSSSKPGWWAYLITNTTPHGLQFTVRAGFGQKNNPELRDTLPEETHSQLETALQALETALVKGVYYLGLLKR